MAENKQDEKEELKADPDAVENIGLVSKLFTSRLNSTLTNIAKASLNWLVSNKQDNIHWSFDLSNHKMNYIAFTIDDSPGIDLDGTMELLDFLKKLNIQITFFIISSMVRDPISKKVNPDAAKIINRMILDGHELANHAVYDEKLIKMEENEYFDKIKECEETICLFDKNFRNKSIKWYRPPSGIMTKTHYNALTRLNYSIAMANKWALDDQNCSNTNYLVNFYTKNAVKGDIMIIHTPDSKLNRYPLLKATKIIISQLHKNGMLLTTLSNVYNTSKEKNC